LFQTAITAKHLNLLRLHTHPLNFFRDIVVIMADISNLSQLLEASLDPRRNKEGK
jgi:hypothetical protein